MNEIDTKFKKIASSYTKKVKIMNICGIKDIKFSSKKLLPLEWWIDYNGSSIYPGHEYKSGFFLMSQDFLPSMIKRSSQTHIQLPYFS